MSAWDVAVAWTMWNVVMPFAGFVAFMLAVGGVVWLIDRHDKKEKQKNSARGL